MSDLVLGVDQTLSNCGMVLVQITDTGPVFVSKKTLKSKTAIDTIDDTLDRAMELFLELTIELGLIRQCYMQPFRIVHEIPTKSNRLQRPESSLLAAMALRHAARDNSLPITSVSANKAKAHFTGNGNARKAQMRERLWEFYPDLKAHKMNEHEADAIALIITQRWPELSVKNRGLKRREEAADV